MSATRIAHVSQVYQSLGGIEAILRRHHERDAASGLDSRFIILNERATQQERIEFLGFNRWNTAHGMRRRMAEAVRRARPELVVYHSISSMRPYCCDVDGARRRVVFFHGVGSREETDLYLMTRHRLLDGVLCVSPASADIARKWLPALEPERIALLPLPVSPRCAAAQAGGWGGRPLRLGYCGRLMHEHKRVDRLPEFCAALDRAGVRHELEVLGDGPERAWLEARMAGRPGVVFHGRREGDAYWQILSRWDAIVFFSDTEGQPVSLLEAMSCGVVPVFPRIGSGGDAHVEGVRASLLYAPGDMAGAAGELEQLGRMTEEEVLMLRSRCREAVREHLGDGYFKKFAAFAALMLALPRISARESGLRTGLLDHVPMALLTHLALARRRALRAVTRPSG